MSEKRWVSCVEWRYSTKNPVPHSSDVTRLWDGTPALLNIEHRVRQTHLLKTVRPECGVFLMATKIGEMVLDCIRMVQEFNLKPRFPAPNRTPRRWVQSTDQGMGIATQNQHQNCLL